MLSIVMAQVGSVMPVLGSPQGSGVAATTNQFIAVAVVPGQPIVVVPGQPIAIQ